MNTMFYVVCIVVAVLVRGLLQPVVLKVKNKKREQDPELDAVAAEDRDAWKSEFESLERIVTESKRDIGREIDNL